jgi:Acidic N-terminal SPT6
MMTTKMTSLSTRKPAKLEIVTGMAGSKTRAKTRRTTMMKKKLERLAKIRRDLVVVSLTPS